MATYAIGDIQGCFVPLQQLLSVIKFNPAQDQLWLTGDLVNRGTGSLQVLRWAKSLGDRVICVLGNHDLHFLAVATGAVSIKKSDTFQEVLQAPDLPELIMWLRQMPLLYYDAASQYVLVHAGIAPMWSLPQAQQYAAEIHQYLQSENYSLLLQNMYGQHTLDWHDNLTGWPRYQLIINYFTRLRYVDKQGRPLLTYKGDVANAPRDHIPWFNLRPHSHLKIIFGHWAALEGKTTVPNIFPLDTGCCWGKSLTAMCLEDQAYYQVNCPSLGTKIT